MHSPFWQKLQKITAQAKKNWPIAGFTTFKVGGPADYLLKAEKMDEISSAIQLCKEYGIEYKLIGAGSNLIVSDSGYRGLLIINACSEWHISSDEKGKVEMGIRTAPRLTNVGTQFSPTDDLTYADTHSKTVIVHAQAGVKLIPFIKQLFNEGITGLQWFSGIPATVGGALFMNMHGGAHFFGDYVHSATLFDGTKCKKVEASYFKFGYDWSILHETGEQILDVNLRLFKGDVDAARTLSREWAKRKSIQPQKSAGCIFHNLKPDEQEKLNLPTPSVGYLIEHVLKLKGLVKGGAAISNNHAAFIENIGNATAADIFYLYNLIKERAHAQLGINLIAEVEFLGTF